MYKFFLGLVAAVCMSAAAQAGTITDFVQVNTDQMNDPALAGFTTWAMRVEADTDWTNADIDINLSSGQLNHLEAGGFPGGPTPGPAGLGDTALFDPITDLGNLFGGFSGPNLAAGWVETPTEFAGAWFNTPTNDMGTFDIAMITISSDANGELLFRTISGSLVEEGGFGIEGGAVFTIANGAIVRVPEPTTLVLAGLSLCGVLALRRRS